MQKKKDKLLGRIVKKDYNNKLEEVLEHKNFSEHTKSLLLSMLYKIETAYSDYETAKHNVETKDEYIEKVISLIKNECNLINVVSPNTPEGQNLGRRTFLIDKEKRIITSYPIERKILYAISKISKKDLILDKSKYDLFAKPITDLINIGNNINTVEPLRDFNGYSWTTIIGEIESVEHNLVYQNLRILLGYQFLNLWVENREFVSDYMVSAKKKLTNRYGEANANKVLEMIYKLAILLECKYDIQEKENLEKLKSETLAQIQQVENISQFALQVSERKKGINSKIKRIDKILNNEALLQQEYDARNSVLPLEQKIFSTRVLAEQLVKEREEEFEKIEKLNQLLIPQNFVKYKRELENKGRYISLIQTENLESEIKKALIKMQKIFLQCFVTKIQQAQTKTQIMEWIYEFRYYYILPFDRENAICEVPELQQVIEKTITILLAKTKEEGITGIFTDKEEIENKIFREILLLRTIEIDNIYMKITKEKDIIYLQLFDGDSFERKVELVSAQDITKKNLDIRLNKKFKVFY